MRICVPYYPSDYPSWLGGNRLLRPAYELLCKASSYKRNPRDERYMNSLVTKLFTDNCQWIDARSLRPEFLKNAREVVLLWPDGNGYGWFRVERRIFAWKDENCKVMVLNGRRRYFQLNLGLWTTYLVRRCLERFWVGELGFIVIFMLVSPVITAWDLSRGRK